MDRAEVEQRVRSVLTARGKMPIDVSQLDATASLYDAGMTSHSTAKVMLGLEDQFDLEFPDELLERSVFDRITTIVDAIEKLLIDS